MLTYILFVAGFYFLIKGADLLIDGAGSIAKKLNISTITIGLTVVAFGTSAPEFVVNIIATANGNTELAVGNILGSNISNILLILGISAVIYPITAKKNTVIKEIPFSLLASLIVAFAANDVLLDGGSLSAITRIDGLIFISFFIIFMYYSFGLTKSDEDIIALKKIESYSYLKSVIFILSGLAGLTFGGKCIVDGAVKMAEYFGVGQSLIGLTIVAVGTSLPELATSAVSAYKRQADIAIGNVVGSNIFNIFWVLGFSALIRPLPFNQKSNIDILMAVFANLFLFAIMFIGKKHVIERWKGAVMLVIYFSYITFLIIYS
ncbi:MAG: calcium/sodium antiporter [Spirochaetes bacterium]|jgi:cation:H+ antiporter|nr:calcium/sodium antiporter [Spirochaetota bacterium]